MMRASDTGDIYIAEGPGNAEARWEQSSQGLRLLALHRRHAQLQAEWAALSEHQSGGVAPGESGEAALTFNLQFVPGFEEATAPGEMAEALDADLKRRLQTTTEWATRLRGEEAQLQRERAELQTLVAPLAPRPLSLRQLLRHARDQFRRAVPPRLCHVPGPVIFRHVFRRRTVRFDAAARALRVVAAPVARWLVHADGEPGGGLWLVQQTRRTLSGEALRRLRSEDEALADEMQRLRQRLELTEGTGPALRMEVPLPSDRLESTTDAGRWIAQIDGPLSVVVLLERTDAYLRDEDAPRSPHDEQVLPLLLRRALVQRGHEVPGVLRAATD